MESAADLKFRRASKSELEEEESRQQRRRSRERSKCWLEKNRFSIVAPTNLQNIERVSRRERWEESGMVGN